MKGSAGTDAPSLVATLVAVAGLLCALASPAPAGAQILGPLPSASTDSALIAMIEAEGAGFPRDSVVPEPRARLAALARPGGPTRKCVAVPPEAGVVVRSGEFLIGGYFPELAHGRPVKVWWKPLVSTMQMVLLVRGRSLGTPTDTMRMEFTDVAAPHDSRTLEPYPEHAFFPTGTVFPSSGTWVVVATTLRNWGCFVFPVE